MIAVVNKAIRAVTPTRASKADKVVNLEQVVVIRGTRDSAQAQIAVISQDSKVVSRDSKASSRDSKAIRQIVTASRASKKKHLQIVTVHLITMIRTQIRANTKL